MTRRSAQLAAFLAAFLVLSIAISSAFGAGAAQAATVWNVGMTMTDDMITYFDPTFIIIHTGDTINWTLYGVGSVRISSDAGQAETWSSGLLSVGGSYQHMFTLPGSYFYRVSSGTSDIGAVIVEGAPITLPGNETSPGTDGNQTIPVIPGNQTFPSSGGAVVGEPLAAFAGGVVYLVFQACFLLGAGGALVSLATAVAGAATKSRDYRKFDESAARAASLLTVVASASLIGLMVANVAGPPSLFTLPFLASIFGLPLYLTLLLLSASALLLWTGSRDGREKYGRRVFVTRAAAASSSVAAVFTFNLVNSFMLSPHLPDGALAVIESGTLDAFRQLSLMVNLGWIPLSVKLLLVGGMSFAALMSGLAVLARADGSDPAKSSFDFVISWGFKVGLFFGAPLGIFGYLDSAVLHATTPVLAMALMGKATSGVAASLTSTVSILWDVAIVGAMSFAALATAFYLPSGLRRLRPGSAAGLVTGRFLPWLLLLLGLSVVGVLYVGEFYPGQYVLGIGVLVGGFFMWEALRRYSQGRLRLYVPVALFGAACYAFIAYMAPHTEWYMASKFGGICWPLVGFPLLVVLGAYAAARSRKAWHSIPLIVAFFAPLVIMVKSADVQLVKGTGIIAVDPSLRGVLQSWAYTGGHALAPLVQAYYSPSSYELTLMLLAAFGVFLAAACALHRGIRSRYTSDCGSGADSIDLSRTQGSTS